MPSRPPIGYTYGISAHSVVLRSQVILRSQLGFAQVSPLSISCLVLIRHVVLSYHNRLFSYFINSAYESEQRGVSAVSPKPVRPSSHLKKIRKILRLGDCRSKSSRGRTAPASFGAAVRTSNSLGQLSTNRLSTDKDSVRQHICL